MDSYGHWTVIDTTGTGGLLCLCICGTQKRVQASKLREGRSRSCGCRGLVAGNRYGRWTILKPVADDPQKALCGCDCGTEREVFRHKLTALQSTSCGCTRADTRRLNSRA